MERLLITVKNVKELERFESYFKMIFVKFECDSNCWNLKKHETIILNLSDYEEMLKNGYFYG